MLALLLLFPGLQMGPLSYGRWMPVHLNVQLFGWTALPLVGWLLGIYGVGSKWSTAAIWGWSGALGGGALAWLAGGSSGKIFLDWQGGALWSFLAALGFLWLALARGWWRGQRRWLGLCGLVILAGVPWALWQASLPTGYPPIDPSTGGPTGASLLGSTLVVVALLLLLPRACQLGSRAVPWQLAGFFTLSLGVFAVAETIGGSHRDLLQIGALGLLLPWPWLVWRDWRRFAWPAQSGAWRVAVMLWWMVLVFSGFAMFLPGALDGLKFTSGLVAHSHMAMAGFTTSFCVLLLRLNGGVFGTRTGAIAWNAAALAMVVVLAATGWAEGRDYAWMAQAPGWRVLAFGLRALCGLVMLAASLHWLLTWRMSAAGSPHETHSLGSQCGAWSDGCAHRIDADFRPGAGAAPARSRAAGRRGAGLAKLDWRLCGLGRFLLRVCPQRWSGCGNRLALHRAGTHGGGVLSGREDFLGGSGAGVGAGGRQRCVRGDAPVDRPEGALVAGAWVTAARGAGVVAMVYAHFLIFAQFAWVELLRAAGGTPMSEKIALGSMAAAGMAAGFWVARRERRPWLIRVALGGAALSAALAPWAAAGPWALGISILTGAAIGTMTVSLAVTLPRWGGIVWAGLGTGLGYALCNLPPVFAATPAQQTMVAVGFALIGALLVPTVEQAATIPATVRRPRPGATSVVLAFTALVWLDSAAFFIIQHQTALKSATWGDPMLWRNALVHFAVALAAGFWLRRGFSAVLVTAWAFLAAAVVALSSPDLRGLAGWGYPVGVSLYSTALVVWPGFLAGGAEPRVIARRAAWLFAVAGWFGSANGIGMVQALHHVPHGFVAAAGLVVVATQVLGRRHWPTLAALVAVGGIAWWSESPSPPASTPAERGRQVYIAEGCIHCHSQFVRPNSWEVPIWGPASTPAAVLANAPVLIGNRRHGPDLANVGARRSAAWLKLHFLNPRDLNPDSVMPSYAGLFHDGRGDDLVAFLRAVPPEASAAVVASAAAWSPVAATVLPDAAPLFARHCAACHGPDAMGNGKLAPTLAKPPANLRRGPFLWSPNGPELETRLARIIKFGVPGTDMPGHETLTDAQVLALARYVLGLRP